MMKVLKSALAGIALLAGIFIIAGLVLHFTAPAISLQHALRQARYGLLVWRLCLYLTCTTLALSLYRRLPPQGRQKLKRVALWTLALLAANELSNLLQWGNGI